MHCSSLESSCVDPERGLPLENTSCLFKASLLPPWFSLFYCQSTRSEGVRGSRFGGCWGTLSQTWVTGSITARSEDISARLMHVVREL